MRPDIALTSIEPEKWPSFVMANDQYANPVVNYAEQEMVREPVQVYAPQIALTGLVRFRRLGCCLIVRLQLGIELLCELRPATLSR